MEKEEDEDDGVEAKSLKELLTELQDQELLTKEEAQTIEATGRKADAIISGNDESRRNWFSEGQMRKVKEKNALLPADCKAVGDFEAS